MLMVILGGAASLSGPVIGAFRHHPAQQFHQYLYSALDFRARRTLCGCHAGRAGRYRGRSQKGASTAPRACVMAALEFHSIAINFGGVKAVSDVTISVAEGERRVMLGPNGAGKSTLFNMIGGQLLPRQGRIALFGRDVTRLSANARAHAGIARTFQITSLFSTQTVEENVYLAVQGTSPNRYTLWRPLPVSRDDAMCRTGPCRMAPRRHKARSARDLSYGEQRKLEIVDGTGAATAPAAARRAYRRPID